MNRLCSQASNRILLLLVFVACGPDCRSATASVWARPRDAQEQRDLLSSLVQTSDHIVVARVDSSDGWSHGMVHCTVLDYLKGQRFPHGRLSYCDHGDPPATGTTYLLFLMASVRFGLVLTVPPFNYEVRDSETVNVRSGLYSTSWPAYRDTIRQELDALTVEALTLQAECIVRGEVTGWMVPTSYRNIPDRIEVRVRVCYSSPALVDSGEVVSVELPSFAKEPFKLLYPPALVDGSEVLLFLDRPEPGRLVLHRGLYGVWTIADNLASVRFCGSFERADPLHTLAQAPADSLLRAVRRQRTGE